MLRGRLIAAQEVCAIISITEGIDPNQIDAVEACANSSEHIVDAPQLFILTYTIRGLHCLTQTIRCE